MWWRLCWPPKSKQFGFCKQEPIDFEALLQTTKLHARLVTQSWCSRRWMVLYGTSTLIAQLSLWIELTWSKNTTIVSTAARETEPWWLTERLLDADAEDSVRERFFPIDVTSTWLLKQLPVSVLCIFTWCYLTGFNMPTCQVSLRMAVPLLDQMSHFQGGRDINLWAMVVGKSSDLVSDCYWTLFGNFVNTSPADKATK